MKKMIKTVFKGTLPFVLTASLLLFLAALMPAGRASAGVTIDHRIVDASVAVGTLYGDPFADLNSVAAGTELSAKLANTIETGHPKVIPFAPALSKKYGTLDNLTFLTGSLTRYGNAGQQLVDAFNSYFAGLYRQTARCGTKRFNVPGALRCGHRFAYLRPFPAELRR